MMKMLSKADSIANDALDDKVYKVGADDIDDVMTNTVQICFFDYLVPSREYTDLLSNTIEYIGGYNPSGINYMENTNDKNFEYKGIMLFAISNILTED
jgi:restriction endonuclease S subunit